VDGLLQPPSRSRMLERSGFIRQPSALRKVLPRPRRKTHPHPRGAPLRVQGELQPHASGVSAATVSRREIRHSDSPPRQSHRVADQAASAVQRRAAQLTQGADSNAAAIAQLWACGEEVRGWARYWAAIYEFIARRLDENPALRQAALVVRFEDLCAAPEETLIRLRDHCALDDRDLIARWAERLHAPAYYRARFSDEDLRIIAEEAGAVALSFGYDPLDPVGRSLPIPAGIEQRSPA
jgi:hypothetical protein